MKGLPTRFLTTWSFVLVVLACMPVPESLSQLETNQENEVTRLLREKFNLIRQSNHLLRRGLDADSRSEQIRFHQRSIEICWRVLDLNQQLIERFKAKKNPNDFIVMSINEAVSDVANGLTQAGNLYLMCGQPDQAESCFSKALQVCHQNHPNDQSKIKQLYRLRAKANEFQQFDADERELLGRLEVARRLIRNLERANKWQEVGARLTAIIDVLHDNHLVSDYNLLMLHLSRNKALSMLPSEKNNVLTNAEVLYQYSLDTFGANHQETAFSLLKKVEVMMTVADQIQSAKNGQDTNEMDRVSASLLDKLYNDLNADSIEFSTDENRQLTKINCLQLLGSLKIRQSEWKLAANYSKLALKEIQKFPVDWSPLAESEVANLQTLALASIKNGRPQEAWGIFDQSLKIERNLLCARLRKLQTGLQKSARGYTPYSIHFSLGEALSFALQFGRFDDQIDQARQVAEWTLNLKGLNTAAAMDQNIHQGLDPLSAWMSLDEIRRKIPDESVWIEFVRYQKFDFAVPIVSRAWAEERYAAILIGRDPNTKVEVIDLGTTLNINKAVNSAHEAIASSLQDKQGRPGPIKTMGLDVAHDQAMSVLAEAARLVWQPLQQSRLLQNAKRLILVPDSELWKLSFHALPVGDRFLIEEKEVLYANSVMDWSRNVPRPGNRDDVVCFGNADFASKNQNRRGFHNHVPTQELAALFRGQLSRVPDPFSKVVMGHLAQIGNGPPIVFQGAEANEFNFLNNPSPKVIFVFSHAASTPANLIANYQYALHDSGIALAGAANELNDPAINDGILLAQEIAQLHDTNGTELVFLGVCQGAFGQPQIGDGMLGLRLAFHISGAKNVVAATWQTMPNETSRLIELVTENMATQPNAMVYSNFRNAQLALIKEQQKQKGVAHPYYWAAYSMTSNGISGDFMAKPQ